MDELRKIFEGKEIDEFIKGLATKSFAEIEAVIKQVEQVKNTGTDPDVKRTAERIEIKLRNAKQAKMDANHKWSSQIKDANIEKKRLSYPLLQAKQNLELAAYKMGYTAGQQICDGLVLEKGVFDSFEKDADLKAQREIQDEDVKNSYNEDLTFRISVYENQMKEVSLIDAQIADYQKFQGQVMDGSFPGLADQMVSYNPTIDLTEPKTKDIHDRTVERIDAFAKEYERITMNINSVDDICALSFDNLDILITQESALIEKMQKEPLYNSKAKYMNDFNSLYAKLSKILESANKDVDHAKFIKHNKDMDVLKMNKELATKKALFNNVERESLVMGFAIGAISQEKIDLYNKTAANKIGAVELQNEKRAAMSSNDLYMQQYKTKLASVTALKNKVTSMEEEIDKIKNGGISPSCAKYIEDHKGVKCGMAYLNDTPVIDQQKDNGLNPINPSQDPDLDPNKKPDGLDPIDPSQDPDLNPDTPDQTQTPPGDTGDGGNTTPDADDKDKDKDKDQSKDGPKKANGDPVKTAKKEKAKKIMKKVGVALGLVAIAALAGSIVGFLVAPGAISALSTAALASPTLSGIAVGSVASLAIEHGAGGKSK